MGYEYIDFEVYQFNCKSEEAVVSALGPPILEDNVIALLVSELAKTRLQGVDLASVFRARCHAQKADPVDLPRWLRARHEWPSGCHAAKKCDELAPLHVPSTRDHGFGLKLALCEQDVREKRRILGHAIRPNVRFGS